MIAKPQPRLLAQRAKKAATAAQDRAESAKVKKRSGGRCEVVCVINEPLERRCHLRASQVHHLISGIGRRNIGKSILAEHKLHVCKNCHEEIHGHVLVPVNAYEREDAATVRYERRR